MRFMKWASMVGFCAVAFVPALASAQQWVMNCKTNLCMDATSEGKVQVSECDKEKKLENQKWDGQSEAPRIKNVGNGKCLDMTEDGQIQTNDCSSELKAQEWDSTQDQNGSTIGNKYFTGKCLSGGDNNLDPVKSADCDDSQEQKWKWVNVGDTQQGCPPKDESAQTDEKQTDENKTKETTKE